MKTQFSSKWYIAIKIAPLVILVVAVKSLLHVFNLEFISVNPLFTGLIGANVFLLGFLLAGTLADYKESEKLPGELCISVEAIADECMITYKNKKAEKAKECLKYVLDLTLSIRNWLYKKEKTETIFHQITGLNDFFLAFESLTHPPFIVRLKQEQSNIRRHITRINTIRETSFVSAGYAIAEVIVFFIVVGVMLTKMDPFYESLFIAVLVSFFMIYMIALIKDLDDPFEYYEDGKSRGSAEVSLAPLDDLLARLEETVRSVG